ncbi:cadherin 87A isoform X2 [Oratosquilla oratoria]|uniref:cadherin 87A isoform X2 n=1 Tax=Oratosquilla oratoria TaxID=337810 RepID=UPI003F76CF4A
MDPHNAAARTGLVLLLVTLQGVAANLPPTLTADMNLHVVNEDTPIGTAIYTLQAQDPEGSRVKFGLSGTDRLKVDPDSGVVRIARPLDREKNDTLRLLVTAEDEVRGGTDNNLVRVPVSLIVLDTNDNPPSFRLGPYESRVPEDTPVGSTVFRGIELVDPDLVGDAISVTCQALPQVPEACDVFEVSAQESTTRKYEGVLILRQPLSYTRRSAYEFKLIAHDGKHNRSTTVSLRVGDVQNSPPVFSGSLTGIVSEDDPIGTLVLHLQASDQDAGNPRPVLYQMIENPFDFFLLDPETGELRTGKPLDKEALSSPDGVVRVKVKAYEVYPGGVAVGSRDSETLAEVTITIRDVNDESPKFNGREYTAEIPEGVPNGTPLPNLDMFVQDTDVGSNSVFSLRLLDTSGIFSVEPEVASGSSSVSIRVARGPLDYENPNQRKFILLVVAEETLTNPRLSSTATVTVSITDINDNSPQFEREAYTALVSESATPGTLVTTISAQDRDKGIFGKEGIQYSLFGNGAEKFSVDKSSGVITVALCTTPGSGNCLDYEEKPTYFLSFQATDAEGSGHTTVVPVKISLLDSNDNPPRFTEEVYRAVIDEGDTQFNPALKVTAIDPDATSRVTYKLVSGDPTGLFAIDASTGHIRVANESGLDISNLKSDLIILTVEASDGEGSHTANVRVSVRDANNNKPIFGKTSYEAAVQENAPPGTVVEQVSATDADTGVNAELRYRIQRGGYDHFAIDPVSGVVSVAAKLDYDRRDGYTIEILAADGGTPKQTSTTTLSVSVINNNDKTPYFAPTTQRTQVSEDASPGYVLYQLIATDPDVESPDGLQFSVVEPISAVDKDGRQLDEAKTDFKNFFAVDPQSGQVSVARPLDRNIATVVTMTVTVTDVSATPPQVGQGSLVVTIVDVNDFPPVFPAPWAPESPILSVSVAEELPPGSLVTTITATDVDSNIAGYALAEPSEYFALDNATGVVTVKSRMDFESSSSLNFTVVAFDTGVPQLSASALVIVEIENVNDEDPVFSMAIYEAEVNENSPPGTLVTTVVATDADEGEFGQITYSLAGEYAEEFDVDAEGRISVREGSFLDRELLASFTLRVVATDTAPDNQRRQTSVPLHVKVLDENDHGPVFSEKEYRASIVENIPLDPPSPIVQVIAHDKDEGINAALLYTITGGNDEGAFRMDGATGIVYPATALRGRVQAYTLTVEARDRNGTGEYSDVAEVSITVLQQNQHKPRFISPAVPNATVYVPENGSVEEYSVLRVEAEDKDAEGPNSRVRYHLRLGDDNLQETPEFKLDPETGQLTTRKILDREVTPKYELVLVAKDQGSPISYETLRFLTVLIQDVNDNQPQFPRIDNLFPFKFTVIENSPKNTLVGELKAEDPDDGTNAKIFYYIVKGNADKAFYIDKLHGKLYTNAVLDREEKSSYNLVVKATNDPNFILPGGEEEVVTERDDTTLAFVTINVDDVNDTPPSFMKKVYYAGVSHEAEVDRFVRMIEAVDGDAGVNGTLAYAITASNLYRPGEVESVGSLVPSPFNVTRKGKLTTAALMSQYRRHRFLLSVQAKEEAPPYRIATCKVNVWVWEKEELVRVVLAQPPEQVVERQEEIVDSLSSVSQGRAVVDEIRYHVDPDNSVNKEWTDMLLHVVNETDQQVLPIPKVLHLLDRGYTHLRNHTERFVIENVYPAFVGLREEEVDARLAGLIALMIVLFIGFISFVVVCCCLRFWVMPPPSRSQEQLITRHVEEDLGLNVTENPLWVDQKTKMYEEQELTMHVMNDFENGVNNNSVNNANTGNNSNNNNNNNNNSVTVDAEWSPSRRQSMDFSQMDTQSNTYATIQKSHGGTLRSLQLRNLQGTLTLGEDPGESNDYATLDHLQRQQGIQGPRVPGVQTPLTAYAHAPEQQQQQQNEYHELRTAFTGSTFQPPEAMANRPLPEEPTESSTPFREDGNRPRTSKNLTLNAHGEPVLVAELI